MSERPSKLPLLVMAPLRPDMRTLLGLLREVGGDVRPVNDAEELDRAIDTTAGAVILTEEALTERTIAALAAALERGPQWSAMPILLLSSNEPLTRQVVTRLRAVEPGIPISVIARPAPPLVLLSAVDTAVAARCEQFRTRDLLAAHRKAEAHATFLVNELNHRVQNLFAMVIAIANQTMRGSGGDPDVFLEAFRGRIMAMAEVARLLGGEGWKNADLREIVLRTLAPLVTGDMERRVALAGPTLALDGRRCTALALVLHELATNALKYGALSNDSGTLRLGWRRRDDTIVIEWEEKGGPRVTRPERRGFGTTFIEQAARADLTGEAHLEYQPDGIRCRIRIGVG